jgi:hypothetical protein
MATIAPLDAEYAAWPGHQAHREEDDDDDDDRYDRDNDDDV